ncbi:MAG: ABC transporter permease [Deltaproteobacteria bacterium]|nr:MAG: ABC transporter permease [Deltaproteobacteria bacterium]TMQ18439.1 MAG: ABC transporter permease [Deltaproteobacteria bacterium]
MIRFLVGRLLASVAIVFAVATASFLLLHAAPGGPFDTDERRSPAVARAMEDRYGLHQPLWQQYGRAMAQLARGDLGASMKHDVSVARLIAEHGPISALLGALALAVALVIGATLGAIAAWRRNTWIDALVMAGALIGVSIPAFVLGPLLIAAFALDLGWLPPARVDGARSLILPAITLGGVYLGTIARLTRGGLIDVLDQDFVRTARAKGVPERRVVGRHALRVGITPVVTYLGPATAALISGSFVVEKIFQIPGLGTYFLTSVTERDYPVVTGVFVCYAALLVVLNLAVDVAYGILDPRMREGLP